MSDRAVNGLVEHCSPLDNDMDAYLSPFKQHAWTEGVIENDCFDSPLSLALQSTLFPGKPEGVPYQSLDAEEMQGDNFMTYEFCDGWANLPVDIVSKILEYLPTSSRRVFRATCHGWSKAIGSTFKYV